MNQHLDRLIADYLDGGLEPADEKLLEEMIVADHSARARLVEAARLHRHLAAELGPIDLLDRFTREIHLDSERYVDRVMDDVRAQVRRRPSLRIARQRRRSLWMPTILAATVLLGTLALLSSVWQEPHPSSPASTLSTGSVRLIEGDGSRLLPTGSPLPSEARIVVDDGSRGGVAYADGSSIAFTSGTHATLGATATGGKRIGLSDGQLTAMVSKQTAGRPLEVITPHLAAVVIGTRFTVRSAGESFLSVDEGHVQVRDLAHGDTLVIGDGESLLVRGGSAPVWSRGTLWTLNGQWPRVVTGGRPLHGPHGEELAIASIGYTPSVDNPYFKPDQSVCVQSGKLIDREPQLFILPKGFRLHLRVRAARAGTAMVTMQSGSPPNPNDGNYGSAHFPVGATWREVSLGEGDFDASAPHRTSVVGLPVQALVLWGFGAGELQLSELTLETTAP